MHSDSLNLLADQIYTLLASIVSASSLPLRDRILVHHFQWYPFNSCYLEYMEWHGSDITTILILMLLAT